MSISDLPPFPAPPEGIPRFEHPATVRRGLDYWLAVWLRSGPDCPAGRTAFALASLYAEASHCLGCFDRPARTGARVEVHAA